MPLDSAADRWGTNAASAAMAPGIETLRVAPMRICAYCWLPNHWHFVAWPEHDGDLSQFMQRMTNMHT